MATWRLGANCHRLKKIGVQKYRPLKVILIGFHLWPSHQTANCWHPALVAAQSSPGIPTSGKLQQTFEGDSHWDWTETNVGISILQDQWVCLQGKKLLWLPPEIPSRVLSNER